MFYLFHMLPLACVIVAVRRVAASAGVNTGPANRLRLARCR